MSEYQYYEFRAVDRPLTRKEHKFSNVYHWGNFKGSPGLSAS